MLVIFAKLLKFPLLKIPLPVCPCLCTFFTMGDCPPVVSVFPGPQCSWISLPRCEKWATSLCVISHMSLTCTTLSEKKDVFKARTFSVEMDMCNTWWKEMTIEVFVLDMCCCVIKTSKTWSHSDSWIVVTWHLRLQQCGPKVLLSC